MHLATKVACELRRPVIFRRIVRAHPEGIRSANCDVCPRCGCLLRLEFALSPHLRCARRASEKEDAYERQDKYHGKRTVSCLEAGTSSREGHHDGARYFL